MKIQIFILLIVISGCNRQKTSKQDAEIQQDIAIDKNKYNNVISGNDVAFKNHNKDQPITEYFACLNKGISLHRYTDEQLAEIERTLSAKVRSSHIVVSGYIESSGCSEGYETSNLNICRVFYGKDLLAKYIKKTNGYQHVNIRYRQCNDIQLDSYLIFLVESTNKNLLECIELNFMISAIRATAEVIDLLLKVLNK